MEASLTDSGNIPEGFSKYPKRNLDASQKDSGSNLEKCWALQIVLHGILEAPQRLPNR